MSHRVEIHPVGKSFMVDESQSVLEAALKAGITLRHSCRDGLCGECRAPILSGAVRYIDADGIALEESDLSGKTGLMCVAQPSSDLVIESLEVTELEGISVQKCASRVMKKDIVSDDVVVLRLAPAPGVEFAFKPGQYLDLTLNGCESRSYSMASLPHDSQVELHVRKMVGGSVSPVIFDDMKPKSIVTIEGPFGTFYIRDTTAPIILLCSGTGFAPIKSMMLDLIDQGNQRQVVLYWGGRRVSDLYMDDLCKEWAVDNPWFNYIPVLSESVDEGWEGAIGFVHQAVVENHSDMSTFEAYVCGAPIVVSSAKHSFIEQCNLKAENFYSDAFL